MDGGRRGREGQDWWIGGLVDWYDYFGLGLFDGDLMSWRLYVHKTDGQGK
ncbi:predicted protein [Sclerotinia sclerotiorum 1980 UF-70]|uniref:Uncharacterized protein n=1 Tax=Sclerotinia sclerotiorum (strain ATCC 18683 / 1980 / Ss-1) TaxID=665079 RepID=A7EJS8_SCLS1|nr:predicted protein [Sclerotinia sclerotiorum 1980 UF-70]EDO03094.1 predicted protein [Sclerotinia sclerotiorum 1980 UF-70]